MVHVYARPGVVDVAYAAIGPRPHNASICGDVLVGSGFLVSVAALAMPALPRNMASTTATEMFFMVPDAAVSC